MVGGGSGGFIGVIHRMAAAIDGNIELVSGAFSSSPEKSYKAGKELFLDPERVYGSYQEMVEKESNLPEEKKIDFVSIVTPNYLHFPVATAFMESGINIVCDKPMAVSIEEADKLCKLSKEQDIIFAVTYNYTGYPLVKQAREMIRNGILGKLQKIVVEYSSDWLLNLMESKKRSSKDIWRMVPEKSGRSLAVGDIGSHAENLASYMTGLEIEKLYAVLNSYIPGTELEDEANILMNYNNGVRGILFCSVVAAGEKNNLNIRIYGNKASIEWREREPNYFVLRLLDGPEKIYRSDSDYLEPIARYNIRLPEGHPEGYLEAFANIYTHVARTILARKEGREPHKFDLDFPSIIDGARGVYFINRAVNSGRSGDWVDIDFDSDRIN
jgi:predicted dehydrogenase